MTEDKFNELCDDANRRISMRHYPECESLGPSKYSFLSEQEKDEFWSMFNEVTAKATQ